MSIQDDQNSPSSSDFEKKIKQYQETPIDKKTQTELNQPFRSGTRTLNKEDKSFLDNLIKHIESKDIDLYKPNSILNQEVYNQLNGEKKAQADTFANATLALIRQVNSLYQSDHSNDSEMMINMVRDLRMRTEKLENKLGNVLKI
ncbi:MAG: hypothetical protein U1C97_00660 [Candidatus Gracilibacteria bacterium]|nr:hypothetical protein [bacterium]MDZ4216813.1 hypothetical protein [Candidatus Gracilibacteria bacterium]